LLHLLRESRDVAVAGRACVLGEGLRADEGLAADDAARVDVAGGELVLLPRGLRGEGALALTAHVLRSLPTAVAAAVATAVAAARVMVPGVALVLLESFRRGKVARTKGARPGARRRGMQAAGARAGLGTGAWRSLASRVTRGRTGSVLAEELAHLHPLDLDEEVGVLHLVLDELDQPRLLRHLEIAELAAPDADELSLPCA
ncbi:hypothetical protein T492DRAFT_993416, partial [Pavlovales sp. CCMP2436]